MDFLKKHHEKLILALALLILIGTAGYLAIKVDSLKKGAKNDGAYPTTKADIKPGDTSDYKKAVAALSAPFVWTHSASNMFGFVPVSAIITNTGSSGEVVYVPPVELVDTQVRQFPLMFRAYVLVPETKQGRNFQVSTRNRTYFVDEIGKTLDGTPNSYKLTKFEQKIVNVEVPGIGLQPRDLSEITLERQGEEPVVLVRDRVAALNPVAILRCRRPIEKLITVKRGDSLECAGEGWKVVDIASKQVVIVQTKTGQELTLSPAPATP